MKLLVEGMSSKEIAASLNLSLNAVREHRGCAYKRLGVHNTAQAIQHFLRMEGRLS